MAQAGVTMAHKMFAKMNEAPSDKNNVLISPLSLQLALALTLEAAAEETAAQLRTLLGFSADTSFDQVHQAMAALATQVGEREGGLSLATALWVHENLPLDPGFIARAAAVGGANAQTVDFAKSDAARAVINDWVEEKTHGKISDLIPSGVLDRLTRLVITSAVHFKAQWATKFKANDTQPAPFHLLGGSGSVEVDMMNHSNISIEHGTFEHHQMASLAYKDSPVTMLVLLPNNNSADALQRVRDSLAELPSQVKELVRKQARLALPRFKVETNLELSTLLKSMGATKPFDGQTANFTRLTTTEAAAKDLYVSQVLHKTFIAVDEEGTEAAAATAVVKKSRCRRVSAKTEFIVDRPFVFVLYHTQLESPLFVGQVTSLPPANFEN